MVAKLGQSPFRQQGVSDLACVPSTAEKVAWRLDEVSKEGLSPNRAFICATKAAEAVREHLEWTRLGAYQVRLGTAELDA
jgi:hypothetical protein